MAAWKRPPARFRQRTVPTSVISGGEMRVPPSLKAFSPIWLYVVGLLLSVAALLAYFALYPTTQTPPLP